MATVEAVLVLPFVLTMMFGIAQSFLLSVAHLVVAHAAQRAVRSAVVVLQDAPAYYEGRPRGVIDEGPHTSGAWSPDAIRGQLADSTLSAVQRVVQRERTRLNAIRAAAYLPLSVIGPATWLSGSGRSIGASVDRSAIGQVPSGLLYALGASVVTFPTRPGANTFKRFFGPKDHVTARVTYLFKCEIPIADVLMCDPLHELLLGVVQRRVPGGWGALRERTLALLSAQDRVNRQRRAMDELQDAELAAMQLYLAARGGRYTTMRAEATLPMQGARYYLGGP